MFLFGAVFVHLGDSEARLSRIESTSVGMVAGVQVIARRAEASSVARGKNEQLLRMLVDAE